MTHPRVTLAVVAFNQQDLVGETIAAAFAQDYPNLQIVLSDDASSDATFEIMEAAAAAYRGPHHVVLNRTPGKGGILAHLLSAFARGDGELLVGAAGDDIALPHRVSTLVGHWREDRPAVIYSAFNRVDAGGRFLGRGTVADQRDSDFLAFFPGGPAAAAFGCSAAYASDFIATIRPPEFPLWAEDYYLSLVAAARGHRIRYVDEALVDYRQNPDALRNFTAETVDHAAYEEKERGFYRNLHATLAHIHGGRDFREAVAAGRLDEKAYISAMRWYDYRARWPDLSFARRLSFAGQVNSRNKLSWYLPRLAGLRRFLYAKARLQGLRRRE